MISKLLCCTSLTAKNDCMHPPICAYLFTSCMHILPHWYYTAYKIYTEIEISKKYVSWDLLNIVPPKYRNHWVLKLVEAATVLPISRFHITVLPKASPVSQTDIISTTKNWEKGLSLCPFTQRLGNAQQRSSLKLELWHVKQCGRQPSCNPQSREQGELGVGGSCAERMKSSSPKTVLPGLPLIPIHPRLPEAQLHSHFRAPWDTLIFFFLIGPQAILEPSDVHCSLTPQEEASLRIL